MSEARAAWMDLPREEHEFQFNPQRAFPNFKDAQEKRTPANAKARSGLSPHLDLPYGEHMLRRLDTFPAMSCAPLWRPHAAPARHLPRHVGRGLASPCLRARRLLAGPGQREFCLRC